VFFGSSWPQPRRYYWTVSQAAEPSFLSVGVHQLITNFHSHVVQLPAASAPPHAAPLLVTCSLRTCLQTTLACDDEQQQQQQQQRTGFLSAGLCLAALPVPVANLGQVCALLIWLFFPGITSSVSLLLSGDSLRCYQSLTGSRLGWALAMLVPGLLVCTASQAMYCLSGNVAPVAMPEVAVQLQQPCMSILCCRCRRPYHIQRCSTTLYCGQSAQSVGVIDSSCSGH
jgi:hypothetical protein